MKILILSSDKSPNNEVIRNLIGDFGGAGHIVDVSLIDPDTDWIVLDDTLTKTAIKLVRPTVPVASKICKIYSNYNNLKLRELFIPIEEKDSSNGVNIN